MRKLLVTALAVAGLLPAIGSATSDDYGNDAQSADTDRSAAYNWFDPAASGLAGKAFSSPGATVAFNPAHPSSWMMIVDPRTHVDWHMAFTNPANYGQFINPQFYMQFMDPNNWLAWMNPASYAVLMNPSTYMWWMTPTAYAHGLDPNNYLQMFNPGNYAAFMNPMTYLQWMNPTAYTMTGVEGSGNPFTPPSE